MNLKTKFFHVINPKPRRCTLALSVPDKEDLKVMLHDHLIACQVVGFSGQLGVALVNPKDRFNHKIGRTVAAGKREEVYYCLYNIERVPGGTVFKFHITNPAKNVLKLQVNFLMTPDKQVVHVQFVDVSPIKRIS